MRNLLSVVIGTLLVFFMATSVHAVEMKEEMIPYTVQKGDSLWEIAQKYKVSIQAIMKANGLSENTLHINQELIIPIDSKKTRHIVQLGESLWEIADTYNLSVSQLRDQNQLTSDTLQIGQILLISTNSSTKFQQNSTIHNEGKPKKVTYQKNWGNPGVLIDKLVPDFRDISTSLTKLFHSTKSFVSNVIPTNLSIISNYSTEHERQTIQNMKDRSALLLNQSISTSRQNVSTKLYVTSQGKASLIGAYSVIKASPTKQSPIEIKEITKSKTNTVRSASLFKPKNEIRQNNQKNSAKTKHYTYTNEDFKWLTKIIEAEAEDQPYIGKVAVGSVIMNRLESKKFPNSIKAIIFQKTGRTFQFSPVGDGRIYRATPSEESIKAARAALSGQDPTKGALYFYNPKIATDRWITTRKVAIKIGEHRFAY